MIHALALAGTASLLALEGWLFIRITHPALPSALRLSLSYPFGVFLNAFLFFILTVAQLPLVLPIVGVAHFALLSSLAVGARGRSFCTACTKIPLAPIHLRSFPVVRAAQTLLLLLIGAIALQAIIHAVMLPTATWDSFTVWHMRAQQSLAASRMLTDGVMKPQYPILLHSLMILPALPTGIWNDTLANAGTLILSLSAFSALFLLLREESGGCAALLTIAALITIPLVAVHLGQGYADIHVAVFVLLSACFFERWRRRGIVADILFSALCVAAAAWTKLEGFYLGAFPWILIFGIIAMARRDRRAFWPSLAILFAFPWMVFVAFLHLSPTPQGIAFGWHIDAFPIALRRLFLTGSFGVHWYVIIVAFVLLCARDRARAFRDHPLLCWGIIATAIVFFVFLATADVQLLKSGATFERAMMLPTLLLTLAVSRRSLIQSKIPSE